MGRWAARLSAVLLVLFVINAVVFMPPFAYSSENDWHQVVLPFYGITMLLRGLASGVMGLVAVIGKHERPWLMWLTLLPGAFVAFCLLG